MLQNKDMNNLYLNNAENIVGKNNVVVHPDDQSGGSTDMGDLSQILPIIHPRSGGAEGTGHGNNYFIKDIKNSDSVSIHLRQDKFLADENHKNLGELNSEFLEHNIKLIKRGNNYFTSRPMSL